MIEHRAIPVSGGWKMAVNNYVDFNAKEIVDRDDPRRRDLNTTLLGLISDSGFVLDVGWAPEADIHGNYRLTLLSDDWSKTYFEYETKDRTDLEKVLFPLLSLQKNELACITRPDFFESGWSSTEKEILISTYLFSGWQMDINRVYANKRMGETLDGVFKCSEVKKRLSLEIEITDENRFVMKLKHAGSSVKELLFENHTTFQNEINDFMIYFHNNLWSVDSKLLLCRYANLRSVQTLFPE